jgi:hypothetical protein
MNNTKIEINLDETECDGVGPIEINCHYLWIVNTLIKRQ